MRFTINGRVYDSADMQEIAVTASGYPTVYIARDYSAFVLVGFDRAVGVTTKSLSVEEFMALGTYYPVPTLIEAIAAVKKHLA